MVGLRTFGDVRANPVSVGCAAPKSMAVGRNGVRGVLALKAAERAIKSVDEAAQILPLAKMVDLVLEHTNNLESVTRVIVQLTAVGHVGLNGVVALNPVELAFEHVTEAVQNHLPILEGSFVKDP